MPFQEKHLKISVNFKEALEDRIVTGHYPPGMRLDEQKLSSEFSISRTPVREALINLSSHGLVEIRPRRGAIVAEVTPARLYEMFEVMAELESMSIRLAARRHTTADFQKINTALEGCGKALETGDTGLYFKENEHFHQAIYGASHNHFLHESTLSISRRLGAYRRLQLRHRGRLHKSYEEHVGIVQALADGNSELAASIIHQHVLVQGEHFSDLLASLENSKKVERRQ